MPARRDRLGIVPEPPSEEPGKIDTSVAHPARVYDFWLGGTFNFEVDQRVGRQAMRDFPGIAAGARAQRAFLGQVAGFLAAEAGIRQFLDLGTGLPSASNTHEVAQRAAPESRIVYVDNDPLVLVHARALLASSPQGATDYLDADVRDTGTVLGRAAETLDFTRPVAIMMIGILQLIGDDDDPYAIVGRLVEAVPSGSWLAIAHPASDVQPDLIKMTARFNERSATPIRLRSRAEVGRFFAGLVLSGPGLVHLGRWEPGGLAAGSGPEIPAWCGLAYKP